MLFDPNNAIIKLCAQGMEKEGEGRPEEAATLFMQAWQEARDNFEKFTAAHYVARHQKTIAEKLKWDEVALQSALAINDEQLKGTYPSLYLNVAKCYEDLNKLEQAKKNYDLALSFASFLPEDGYGKLVKSGIENGLIRISAKKGLSK